jgi:RNA exonuclease 1
MGPVEMEAAGYPVHPYHQKDVANPNLVYTPFSLEFSNASKTIIGMDCEMCKTSQGSEIARVTLVDFQGNTLFDELVKPENPIIDYLTTYDTVI